MNEIKIYSVTKRPNKKQRKILHKHMKEYIKDKGFKSINKCLGYPYEYKGKINTFYLNIDKVLDPGSQVVAVFGRFDNSTSIGNKFSGKYNLTEIDILKMADRFDRYIDKIIKQCDK